MTPDEFKKIRDEADKATIEYLRSCQKITDMEDELCDLRRKHKFLFRMFSEARITLLQARIKQQPGAVLIVDDKDEDNQ